MMFLSKPMLGTQLDHSDSLNNPVLDLLFNEGHGYRVNDLSGYGNHGRLYGFDFPPTRTSGWNPGMDGVALTFDGSDDYIHCGNNPSLDVKNATFMFSINTPIQNNKDIFNHRDWNENASYRIMIDPYNNSENRLSLAYGYGSNWTYLGDPTTTPILTPDTWVDVAITVDNDNLIGKYYLNGLLAETDSMVAPMAPNGKSLCMMGRSDYGKTKGAIARARILPRCMSAFEIMQTQIDPYGVYLR